MRRYSRSLAKIGKLSAVFKIALGCAPVRRFMSPPFF